MNELNMEKWLKQAEEIGFDDSQDELVEVCEALIEAAEGEDYDDFVNSLADITIIVQQVVFTLPEEQRGQYYKAVDTRLNELAGSDEEDPDKYDEKDIDIDPDDTPY